MQRLVVCATCFLISVSTFASPSSTFWAPSTATCQSWAVPHLNYDAYFNQGPAAGIQGAPNYPTDTGITAGFLPFEKLQGELGYDLLLPTNYPLVLNGKLCTPESSLFAGSPALSFGVFGLGFKSGVNDFDVLHLMLQKTIPGIGGYAAIGVYRGMSKTLFTNSRGEVVQSGLMAALYSPELEIGLKGLKKLALAADIQTGKNVLGAWGVGPYIYFTDDINLITGPVFFFDRDLQPGGRSVLWTVQLDANIPLSKTL